MNLDADALNFNLERFGSTNTFSLPQNYNENEERIIAATVYYKYMEFGDNVLDYHYYVRHGNGTCHQAGHRNNCSIWSHKPGTTKVDNCNNLLCDVNISTQALSLISVGAYGTVCNQVRYYRIAKDTHIYDSWHGNGHAITSTGTPYRP